MCSHENCVKLDPLVTRNPLLEVSGGLVRICISITIQAYIRRIVDMNRPVHLSR